MKKIFTAMFLTGMFLTITTMSDSHAASRRVRGYTKSNGTYVASSYRTESDSFKSNNYSTKGNRNPYTGKQGYKLRRK